jgi:hypothetical protein
MLSLPDIRGNIFLIIKYPLTLFVMILLCQRLFHGHRVKFITLYLYHFNKLCLIVWSLFLHMV